MQTGVQMQEEVQTECEKDATKTSFTTLEPQIAVAPIRPFVQKGRFLLLLVLGLTTGGKEPAGPLGEVGLRGWGPPRGDAQPGEHVVNAAGNRGRGWRRLRPHVGSPWGAATKGRQARWVARSLRRREMAVVQAVSVRPCAQVRAARR